MWKEKPKFVKFELFVKIIDHMKIYNLTYRTWLGFPKNFTSVCSFFCDRSMREAYPNRRKNHFGDLPIQLTIVTQALNTRTHTNHTVVTTGSTKALSQKWKNYLVSCCFWLPRGLWEFVGWGRRGGDLAFQGLLQTDSY